MRALILKIQKIWSESFAHKAFLRIAKGADDAVFFKVATAPFEALIKMRADSFVLSGSTAVLRVWVVIVAVCAMMGWHALTAAFSLLFIVKPIAGIYSVTALCMIADVPCIMFFMLSTVAGCFLWLAKSDEYGRAPQRMSLLITFSAFVFIAFSGAKTYMEAVIRILLSLFYLATVSSIKKRDDIINLICIYSAVAGTVAFAEVSGINIGIFKDFTNERNRFFEFYILSIPLAAVCSVRCDGIRRAVSYISIAALFASLSRHIPSGLDGFKAAGFVILLMIRDIRFAVPAIAFLGGIMGLAGMNDVNEIRSAGGLDIGQNLIGRGDIISLCTGALLLAAIYTCGEEGTRKKALMRSALLAVMGAGAIYFGSGGSEGIRIAAVFWVLLSLSSLQAS